MKSCLKSEVGSRKLEVGSRKSDVGSRKSEVGSRKSEVGSPSSAFVAVDAAKEKNISLTHFEIKEGS